MDPDELRELLTDEGFTEVPIVPADLERVGELPWLQLDTFDRMLVAQAAVEGLTLASVNAALKRYGRFVCAV